MTLTTGDVRHIARLARIAVSDAEVERYTAQLDAILAHFDTLSRAPVDDVEATAHPLPLYNVMRPDEVAASLPPAEVLRNAPESEGNLFRVRAVLE